MAPAARPAWAAADEDSGKAACASWRRRQRQRRAQGRRLAWALDRLQAVACHHTAAGAGRRPPAVPAAPQPPLARRQLTLEEAWERAARPAAGGHLDRGAATPAPRGPACCLAGGGSAGVEPAAPPPPPAGPARPAGGGALEKSLKEYVSRMLEGQSDIYYTTGEDIAAVSTSPLCAFLRKKGFEILHLADPIDEYAAQHCEEFDGKKLKAITMQSSDILRFHTSKSGDKQISLNDFVGSMPEGQDDIYYATGKDITAVSKSPFSAFLRKKGLEILYLADPMDEYAVLAQQPKEFDGKTLNPILREGMSIDDEISDETAELLRFLSNKSGDELTSLKEYVSRAGRKQKNIYYNTGKSSSSDGVPASFIQLVKRDVEIIIPADPVDEYAVQQLKKFDGKKLKPTS